MQSRAAIARIDVSRMEGGKAVPIAGATGALVGEGIVLTALHVVADRKKRPPVFFDGQVKLTFPDHITTAKPIEGCHDPEHDWVLLQCETPPPIAPLPLGELGTDDKDKEWETFGFPVANPTGMRVKGEVRLPETKYEGVSAIQLYAIEAAAGDGAPVAGLSGAPCIVDGAIVGVIRSSLVIDKTRNDVGAVNLPGSEGDFDFSGEPPATRPASPGTAAEAAVESGHKVGLRAPVLSAGRSLLDQLPIDDLMMALVLGDGEQILQRGRSVGELLRDAAHAGSIAHASLHGNARRLRARLPRRFSQSWPVVQPYFRSAGL